MSEELRTRAGTAALVLGLISVGLVAYASGTLTRDLGEDAYVNPVSTLGPPILALLAIIFGGLGLRAAAAGAPCRGRSIAGIVLGVLVLMLQLVPYTMA